MTLVDAFADWQRRVVEVTDGHRILLQCPVRERALPDGPEERIRLGLLHFLLEVRRSVDFELHAERERHDIDLRWVTPPDFRPPTAPLLIVETKVDHLAGNWTNFQLARYLAETEGDCGVVFTGRRMWRVTPSPTGPEASVLSSLNELAALVRERAAVDPLAAAHEDFCAARKGDFDALRRLTDRYRFATFVLAIQGIAVPCRHLRFEPGLLVYRPALLYTLHPQRVPLAALERLIRVEA